MIHSTVVLELAAWLASKWLWEVLVTSQVNKDAVDVFFKKMDRDFTVQLHRKRKQKKHFNSLGVSVMSKLLTYEPTFSFFE